MQTASGTPVKSPEKLTVALVWSQFAAYHIDRCEAVAARLAGRADVLAIEIATTSTAYAWEPSGEVPGARKLTLFPGESYDSVSPWRRFRTLWRATRRADLVALGVSYATADAILLGWVLRLTGKQVVVFSETKFDDCRRSVWRELGKSLLLSCYSAAIVGGRRHIDYFRFLGFRRRQVLPGYDGVGLERIRRQAGGAIAPEGVPHEDRHFIFVGRFVDKKNLHRLVDGYARYVALAGSAQARRLVLVGSGDEGVALRGRVAELGIAGLVDLPGFLGAEGVSCALAGSLALLLVSGEEQWGLVVNEALALGLPAVVSQEVGSGDVLVRNLINGFVIESGSPDGMAQAMLALASDRSLWTRMAHASRDRAWLGDAERLADAVELLLYPNAAAASENLGRFAAEMEPAPR